MAGNKINTKQKGKDDKNKSNKSMHHSNEDNEELDFSVLRKPIRTSVTGFAQARKIFDWATEELKGLLSNECDVLYECKVCRNIFRSLANFISHKRVYCKETFNSSSHGHFVKPNSTAKEILRIKRLEEGYQESLKEKNVAEIMDVDEINDRIPLTKDLTTIIEKIAQYKGEKNSEEHHVVLQKIPSSSVAVFQNLEFSEQKQDNMRAQVTELDNILSRDKAILMSDGKFKTQSSTPDLENVIQISDDEENEDGGNLKCKICDQQFSTIKTLKFHMKYKHLESRLVYPCPDCLEIFSTSWSVYRHLFKVHRKTAAQIRKLRESIQAKAFKMNNPPAYYEKRKNMKPPVAQKITEEERLDQENQAWMDNVEGEGETPRCFGCGRSFERRAALAAHAHTCQPRRAVRARRSDTKRIEIQIRKDYHKGPSAVIAGLRTAEAVSESKPTASSPIKTIKEENISENKTEELEEATMDIMNNEPSSKESSKSPEKAEDNKPETVPKFVSKLPYSHQAEKSNITAFRQKILPNIDMTTFACKKCEIQHSNIQELYDHMADHYKWMRYACKLCNFKHYDFEKLPDHVKVVHKLKGDSDFYFSTVKAVDGTEALELSESLEGNDANEVSPDSRRPSRCSSDSSRLSDDSSSSSTRIESGSRKRKMNHSRTHSKKRKEFLNDDDEDFKVTSDLDKDVNTMLIDNDSSSNTKPFEENSSDLDELEDKMNKKTNAERLSSVASRRPIRKKTKPKNEDFEYDLSNLLKMEAQGYRDSQTITSTKIAQSKKKPSLAENYDNINRDCCGALATLSKRASDKAMAVMKSSFILPKVQKDVRLSNIFAKPLPKMLRGDKVSPRKDLTDDSKDSASPHKEQKNKALLGDNVSSLDKVEVTSDNNSYPSDTKPVNTSVGSSENVKSNKRIPAVLPITFRRQSLEAIKPLINKNITDFTKAGMKTKILVIKPINRGKDSAVNPKTPLKFQTIKLKDPSKGSLSNEVNSSDQVMVVKVPTVDCASVRPVPETCTNENEKVILTEENDINNDVSNESSGEVEDGNCSNMQPNDCETAESTLKSIDVSDEPEVIKDNSDNEIKTEINSSENAEGLT
ncbi:uncharacterized protein LOC128671311 [Plodia interpunctella]|uniref:uncharacterized protein LOC128671311 n=1 Tax=Plodia interpunctella TaxID=58824 RepID=UPI0023679602|nr:uncharacterized protein LOC128671311 [Plodia interpunctella]